MRDAMWMTPTGEMMDGTMPTSPRCCPACALLHADRRTGVPFADPHLGTGTAALRTEPGFDAASLRHLTALVSGAAPHASEALLGWLDDGISMMCAWA